MSDLNKLNYKAYIPDKLGLFHTCQMKGTTVLTLLINVLGPDVQN